jgi:hypothetical protein
MAHLPPGSKPPPTTPSTPRGGDGLSHHATTLTDDATPSEPCYSPGPTLDDQFKPFNSPQQQFGGGGGFVGSIAAGFSPPGGSGMGSSLYYGPVPDDDSMYGMYTPRYNNVQSNQAPGSTRDSVSSNTHGRQYVPAGPGMAAGTMAAAAEGALDEEAGAAGAAAPPAATAAARVSRVSFST